jgi:hypothetical protein
VEHSNELRSIAREARRVRPFSPHQEGERLMADDITLHSYQYPARLAVRVTCLGELTLWIHDGCFDVSVQLTPATARTLAERLLAYQSSDALDAGGIGSGDWMPVLPEPEAPLGRDRGRPVATADNELAAGVTEPSPSRDELRGCRTTTPRL